MQLGPVHMTFNQLDSNPIQCQLAVAQNSFHLAAKSDRFADLPVRHSQRTRNIQDAFLRLENLRGGPDRQ